MKVRFIDIGGLQTRCLVAGDPRAYPLLLLHGYGGTADVWLRNIDALGQDFYVVAPDMVNSGFTGPVDLDRSPPQPAAVAHLEKLVDHLGFDTFCAMGTSYGSLISVLLHFALPKRVDKLVLNGSGSAFNEDDKLVATLQRALATFGPVMEEASIEGCRDSMGKQSLDPGALPEEMLPVLATAYAQPWMRRVWEDGLHGLMDLEASRPYSVRDRLQEVTADVLVITGRQDPGAVYESAVAAVGRMKQARLVTFEQCGHKPMYEYPELYHDTVRDFLRDRTGAVAA